jgi:ABC-type phosphate transport system substrate-binding protein
MKPHSTILLLMISLASLVYSLPALAQNGDMAVVVNAKNSVNNLTVTELRNLFAG